MHTHQGVTDGIWFSTSGDFSGEVRITINHDATWEGKDDPAVEFERGIDQDNWLVRIPFEDLLHLVAIYVRDSRISKIEHSMDQEILDL